LTKIMLLCNFVVIPKPIHLSKCIVRFPFGFANLYLEILTHLIVSIKEAAIALVLTMVLANCSTYLNGFKYKNS